MTSILTEESVDALRAESISLIQALNDKMETPELSRFKAPWQRLLESCKTTMYNAENLYKEQMERVREMKERGVRQNLVESEENRALETYVRSFHSERHALRGFVNSCKGI